MPVQRKHTPAEAEKAQAAIRYIRAHHDKPFTPDSLADEVGLPVKKLQELFKLYTGLTVHAFRVKVRVEVAEEDLHDFGKTIKFIAHKYLFSSQSHFIEAFKKYKGLTPYQFRQDLMIVKKP